MWKKRRDVMFKKINIQKGIDMVILFLLCITSIKKGGFYQEDIAFIEFFIMAIGLIDLSIHVILSRNKKKVTICSIFAFFLIIAYSLPILFESYASLADSIYELLRYANFYMIYKIVSLSPYKKIYLKGIVIVAILQCIIGIDGMGVRILEPLFQFMQTGFLDKDLTRMSGTIQYANVFAMLCAIAILLLLASVSLSDKKQKIIKIALIHFLFACMLLTGSRAVMILFVVTVLFTLFQYYTSGKMSKKEIFVLLILFVLDIIFTSIVSMYCLYSVKIYVFFALYVIGNILICHFLFKLPFERIEWKKSVLVLFAGVAGYIVLALFITLPLNLSANTEVTRNIYHFTEGENVLTFQVEEKEEDTRYSICLLKVYEDLSVEEIATVGYYSNTSGNFLVSFEIDEEVKYLQMKVTCEKGEMSLDHVSLNKEKIALNYLLLPYDLVERLVDVLHGSTSITDRLTYITDGFKILTRSFQNFMIGSGGEGFKYQYELVQDRAYVSSEMHSSFLQIFVESGIVGFGIMILLVCFHLKGIKQSGLLPVFFLLICHSMVDLEFSYFLMLFIFAILLGCSGGEEGKRKFSNYYEIIPIVVLCFLWILLAKQNVASKISVNTQNPIVEISQLKRKVTLVPYENDYREELYRAYTSYLNELVEKYQKEPDVALQEEIVKIVQKINENLEIMPKNKSNDKYTMMYVAEGYFEHFIVFSYVFYDDAVEDGYIVYLEKGMDLLENMKVTHPFNQVAQTGYQTIKQELKETLIRENRNLNSVILQNYIETNLE